MVRGVVVLGLLLTTALWSGCVDVDRHPAVSDRIGPIGGQVLDEGVDPVDEERPDREASSGDDEEEYRVDHYEWTGFFSCGYVVVVWAGDACSDVDEQAQRTHPFQLEAGAETVTAVLIWDSNGLLGDDLQYGLAREPCPNNTCVTPTDYYGYTKGASPLELRVDVGGIETPADVQLRVFPPFNSGANVFLQQEFTVYYQLHYHEPAPEDFDPRPDQ